VTGDCPIQVVLYGHWIDCTFPAGHAPWLHSWQIPAAAPFVMAPPASEVRNRDGGPLGYPYDPAADGAALIVAERQRQTTDEGYTAGHDAGHDPDDMIRAAIAYALNDLAAPEHVLSWWPWGDASFKGGPTRVRDLAKAGALIAAAIDRLNAAGDPR
jgi:hypothetical protein